MSGTQYDQIGEAYNRARDTAKGTLHEQWTDGFLDRIVRRLVRGSRVLELGCGDGRALARFQGGMGMEVFGIDESAFMVDLAREKVRNPLSIVQGSNGYLGALADDAFDAIVSRFGAHYGNFEKLYMDAARMLKPNGHLGLIVPHPICDFLSQKNKEYGARETIAVPIYDNAVTVTYESHTFAHYFPSKFFSLFQPVEIAEQTDDNVTIDGLTVPTTLGIHARKR